VLSRRIVITQHASGELRIVGHGQFASGALGQRNGECDSDALLLVIRGLYGDLLGLLGLEAGGDYVERVGVDSELGRVEDDFRRLLEDLQSGEMRELAPTFGKSGEGDSLDGGVAREGQALEVGLEGEVIVLGTDGGRETEVCRRLGRVENCGGRWVGHEKRVIA